MKLRAFVEAIEAAAGETLVLDRDESHHLIRVARAREGELVELFDRRGSHVLARVIDPSRDAAVLSVIEALEGREPASRVTVALALIQPEKFELVLQKATELAAWRFLPIVSERAETPLERIAAKRQRWEKIVLEAVKQSGRTHIPEIADPRPFDEAISIEGAILFESDVEPRLLPTASSPTLFIGPEGGWSEAELKLAQSKNVAIRRLGPRRLRAETAAIAALTLIQAELNEF